MRPSESQPVAKMQKMRERRQTFPRARAVRHHPAEPREMPRREPTHRLSLSGSKRGPGRRRGAGRARRRRRRNDARERLVHVGVSRRDDPRELRRARLVVERRQTRAFVLVEAGRREHLPGRLPESRAIAGRPEKRRESVPQARGGGGAIGDAPATVRDAVLLLLLVVSGRLLGRRRSRARVLVSVFVLARVVDGPAAVDVGVRTRARGVGGGRFSRFPGGDASSLGPSIAAVRLAEHHRSTVFERVAFPLEPGRARAQRMERREALAHRALRARALLIAQRTPKVYPRRLDERHVDERRFALATGRVLDDEHLGKAIRARQVRVRPGALPRHVPRRRRVEPRQRAAGLGTQRTHAELALVSLTRVDVVLAPDAPPLALGNLRQTVAAQVHLHVASVAKHNLVLLAPVIRRALAAHVARVQLRRAFPKRRALARRGITREIHPRSTRARRRRRRGRGRGRGRGRVRVREVRRRRSGRARVAFALLSGPRPAPLARLRVQRRLAGVVRVRLGPATTLPRRSRLGRVGPRLVFGDDVGASREGQSPNHRGGHFPPRHGFLLTVFYRLGAFRRARRATHRFAREARRAFPPRARLDRQLGFPNRRRQRRRRRRRSHRPRRRRRRRATPNRRENFLPARNSTGHGQHRARARRRREREPRDDVPRVPVAALEDVRAAREIRGRRAAVHPRGTDERRRRPRVPSRVLLRRGGERARPDSKPMPKPRVVFVVVVVGGVAPRVAVAVAVAAATAPTRIRETRPGTLGSVRGVEGVRRESRAKPGGILHAFHGRRRVEDVAESPSEFSRGPPVEIRAGERAEQRRRRAEGSSGTVRGGREQRGDGGDDVAVVVGVDEGLGARGLGRELELVRRARARMRGLGRGRVETAARESDRGHVERGEVIAASESAAEEGDAVVQGFAVRLVVHHLVERGAAAGGVHHHRAGRSRRARAGGNARHTPAARRTGRRAGRSARATTSRSGATVGGSDRRARARRRRSAFLAGRIARGEHHRRAATLRATCALSALP